MKKLLLLALSIIAPTLTANAAEPRAERFAFDENGEFLIVQLTDLHWNPQSPTRHRTAKTVEAVLTAEKPDLVILTGDIVTAAPAVQGWNEIAEMMSAAGIPWTITLGNHDDEGRITREEIFDLMTGKPWFVGEKGSGPRGCGNYTIPIYGSDNDRTAALVYCIDSNGYPDRKGYGDYDWIHFDQIAWYRNLSTQWTAQNGGMPLPALAFFHIPTPEYINIADRETTVGSKGEWNCSPVINSGFFGSAIGMGDIMGMFVGHDHNNDYIGTEYGIALAYGRVTGGDAYGKLKRGGRVIRLHENERRFDTWIRTEDGAEPDYHYPAPDLPTND